MQNFAHVLCIHVWKSRIQVRLPAKIRVEVTHFAITGNGLVAFFDRSDRPKRDFVVLDIFL